MAAGAIAGSATVLLTNPIWVVNTRMTARKSESKDAVLPSVGGGGDDKDAAAPRGKKKKAPSTLGTLRALIKDGGFRSLFAGVLPALVLVINPILQYTIFEQLRNVVERRKGRVGPRDAFYLGALGKLLATTITYPYITVKSRAHVASKEGPQDSMMQSLKRVVREEGWAGLYGGESARFWSLDYSVAFLPHSSRLSCAGNEPVSSLTCVLGIGPKVSQSVITAAFLFAFKDVLYDMSVKARQKIPAKVAS